MSERPGHNGWPVSNSAKTHPEGGGTVVIATLCIMHSPHLWPRHPQAARTVCHQLAVQGSDTSGWLHSQCTVLQDQLIVRGEQQIEEEKEEEEEGL